MADTTPQNDTREVIVIHSDASDIESGQVSTKSDSPRKRKRKKQANREEEGSEARPSSGREAKRERRKKLCYEEQASDFGSRNSERRRRSHSPPGHSPSPLPDDSQLFFLDLEPVAVQNVAEKTAKADEQGGPSKLLLPSHVQVLGSVPVETLPPYSPDSGDEDYIDYLDYDDRKGLIRYFDAPEDKPTKTVCKNCGAEGEHTTYKCPVIICLTCGARDEHPTRSCPISKSCFKCGMKGHINVNCPNKFQHQEPIGNICHRCGHRSHIISECPTWWRIYVYISEENERVQILHARRAKSKAGLGEGGEGYIAEDEWCYNCGVEGHWGDDCTNAPHAYGVPEDCSAFGSNNLHTGPFAKVNEAVVRPTISRRGARDWEKEIDIVDNVGRKGKRKAIEMLGRSARRQLEDDDDDWFRKRRGGKESKAAASRTNGKSAKKLTFGQSVKSGLLDRIGDTAIDEEPPKRGRSDREESRRQREQRPPSDKPSSRNKQSDPYDTFSNSRSSRRYEGSYRERDYDRRRPRYSGGYSR
ncbi:hypothetical protein IW261DRAFT_1435232 [Armillaria novae-zelandiae]|uniref:CCHC-type domain-containing protein n=1 Tax=Armillaria novae-zelandiae TaxID=153914 RepID=A0AA39PXN7_9AGAR|nr:hypothetical protein IW261DRAFT_1435232 [Armillaria novae-zelandiae]